MGVAVPNFVWLQLFAKLPDSALKKIEAVEGDCGVTGLGLSDQDRALLLSKVHIVVHAAATVRFDERLPLAVDINVRGTKEMLDLARDMTSLKVHLRWSGNRFTSLKNLKVSFFI